jgi:Domain of unknown function (DUF4335)
MPVLARPISRIYTPPTCTLEVTAQPSALSRWTGTPVIKSLQFLLSFEGLSQGDREPIEIRGNQTQLANLSNVVTDYIQTLLASRATDLSIQPSNLLSHIPHAPPDHPTDPLNESTVITESSLPVSSGSSVQLRPRSLLTHELTLGSLANESSGSSVVLKVSQLYDLATALDDSAADLQHLPALSVASSSWRTALPLAQSAAAVLLAVGLGTAAWQLFQPSFVAVRKPQRSPDITTALAPSASPSSKALPSLRPRPAAPLNLPSIQLPSRSNLPSASSSSINSKGNPKGSDANGQADVFSSSGQSLAKPVTPSGARTQSSSKDSTAQLRQKAQPGEIAIAPAPPQASTSAPAPNPASDSQLSNSQLNNSQFNSRGAFAESRSMAKSSETAPSKAARQSVGQSSLFDTIGQVAEVRDYVASRWQPATPPPKTLEYRLTLNTDGSLAQVDPLGASAQQYLSQLPLPAPQSPFVSAIASGRQPTVRLVVRPDGTVQTFLDGAGR